MTGGLPEDARAFARAMDGRYACKRFDPRKRVGEAERRFILEAGRLSPSSFGLEPWLFLVADSPRLKEGFFRACFDQENLRTADFIVTIAVRGAARYRPDSDFTAQRAARFPEGLTAFLDEYRGYWEHLDANGLTEHWARAQGYVACADMMVAAASLGVDSCAVEGFREDAVLELCRLDPAEWLVSLVVPFGYRGEERRERIREEFDQVVRRLDD